MVYQTLATNIEDDTGMVNWYCFLTILVKQIQSYWSHCVLPMADKFSFFAHGNFLLQQSRPLFFYHPGHWDGKPKMWDNHPNNPALYTSLTI